MVEISRTPSLTDAAARDGRIQTGIEGLTDLKLKLHQTVSAQISDMIPVTAQERALLTADKLAANLSQAVRAAWLKLLSSPNLQLATLKLQGRVLHTLTDQPLLAGQTVSLSLDANGQLRLKLAAPTLQGHSPEGLGEQATPAVKPAATTQRANASPRNTSAPTTSVSTLTAPPKGVENQSAFARPQPDPLPVTRFHQNLEQHLRSELTQAVRRALPTAAPPSRLLASATAVMQALESAASLRHGDAPLAPQLAQLIATAPRWEQWQAAPRTALESTLQRAIAPAPLGQEDASTEPASYPVLVHALRALFATAPQGPATPASPELSGWEKVLWSLTGHHQEAALSEPDRRKLPPLLQQLRESVEGAAARLELNQSRTLLAQTQPNASAHPMYAADIPLRLGEQLFGNAHLQIQEQREKGRPKSARGRSTRSKWVAYLELDINEERGLAIELTLVESEVEATLWCSHKQLHEHAQSKLGELRAAWESEGLEVVDLRCVAQSPPPREAGLDVSLIDVRT